MVKTIKKLYYCCPITLTVTYGFNPKGHMTYRSHRSWFQRQTRLAMPCRMKEISNHQRNENDPLRPSTEELQHQQPTTVAEVCTYMAEERHGTKLLQNCNVILRVIFWKHGSWKITHKLECGPMPNVMAAQPNIGGALCESSVIPFLVPRRGVWLTPAAGVPCSNAANIRERKTCT